MVAELVAILVGVALGVVLSVGEGVASSVGVGIGSPERASLTVTMRRYPAVAFILSVRGANPGDVTVSVWSPAERSEIARGVTPFVSLSIRSVAPSGLVVTETSEALPDVLVSQRTSTALVSSESESVAFTYVNKLGPIVICPCQLAGESTADSGVSLMVYSPEATLSL